jgi:hypothetical protein
MTMTKTYTVRVYTCPKHPNWSLESAGPVLASSLKVFCPHCKDDWMERAIGVADCRFETREPKSSE